MCITLTACHVNLCVLSLDPIRVRIAIREECFPCAEPAAESVHAVSAGDAVQMEPSLLAAPGAALAAAAFSEDTTPGDSPRSGDSAESTSFRCAICLVRSCPAICPASAASRASTTTRFALQRRTTSGSGCLSRIIQSVRRLIYDIIRVQAPMWMPVGLSCGHIFCGECVFQAVGVRAWTRPLDQVRPAALEFHSCPVLIGVPLPG